jgi:hypothetical protein
VEPGANRGAARGLASFLSARGFANDGDELRSVLVAGDVDVPDLEEWVNEWTDDPSVQLVVIPAPHD